MSRPNIRIDSEKALHENRSFSVYATEPAYGDGIEYNGVYYNDYYEVVNRATGVVERKTTLLVEAIYDAERMDIALHKKEWEWLRKEVDANPAQVNPDGTTG